MTRLCLTLAAGLLLCGCAHDAPTPDLGPLRANVRDGKDGVRDTRAHIRSAQAAIVDGDGKVVRLLE